MRRIGWAILPLRNFFISICSYSPFLLFSNFISDVWNKKVNRDKIEVKRRDKRAPWDRLWSTATRLLPKYNIFNYTFFDFFNIFNYNLFNFFNILTTICSHFQHLQWQFSHFFFDKHNNKFPHFVIILNYKWLIYLTFLPTNHFLTSWGEGEGGGAQISSSPSKHFLFLFVLEVYNISVSVSTYLW